MKTIALLATLSLVAVVGCADNEEPTTPPPSETSRAVEPSPSAPPPETSQSMEPSSPSSSPAETQKTQPEQPPAMGGATATANDQELQKRIQEALKEDTGLADAAEHVQIDTTAGKVTLRGSVPSEEEKEEIATKVKQMEGVQEVDNQLQVASR